MKQLPQFNYLLNQLSSLSINYPSSSFNYTCSSTKSSIYPSLYSTTSVHSTNSINNTSLSINYPGFQENTPVVLPTHPSLRSNYTCSSTNTSIYPSFSRNYSLYTFQLHMCRQINQGSQNHLHVLRSHHKVQLNTFHLKKLDVQI